MLDSTDAAAVRAVEDAIDVDRTLFLVSSKSGGTIETLSHVQALLGAQAGDGEHFVAITDPGLGLATLAAEHGFRRVFLNDPDIGGRYSALSYFGLVPAALMGADVEALLRRRRAGRAGVRALRRRRRNSGLWLGIALGELALHGRDKLTFVVDDADRVASACGSSSSSPSRPASRARASCRSPTSRSAQPDDYGDDRVFVHLRTRRPDDDDARSRRCATPASRCSRSRVGGPEDLGRIFFFAEFATAVAGWVLGSTRSTSPTCRRPRTRPSACSSTADADRRQADDGDLRRAARATRRRRRYVAIMGYVQPTDEFDAAIARAARARSATRRRPTTTFGYGPRFLHSTGQLHKGGPPTGRFLQLVHDGPSDVDDPGAPATRSRRSSTRRRSATCRRCATHGLPAERVTLRRRRPGGALRDLTATIKESC